MSIWSSLFGKQEIKPAVGGQMISTTELPAELKPYYKDILTKAQALYNDRTSQGYQLYEGATLADFTPEQQQVQTGLAGLVGSQAPAYQEAMGMTREATTPYSSEQIEEYMSPYQQAVTDIEKREATKQYESQVQPQLAAKAAMTQPFGGSRQAILEGMASDTQQRLLSDLQAKGSAQSYQDAISRLDADRLAKGQGASQLANLASGQYKGAASEFAGLQLSGEEQQRQNQTALDEAFKQKLEEQQFPYDTMGKYQSMVIGAPMGQTTYSKPQAAVMGPSFGQQLIGGLGGLGNIYGSFTGRTIGGQDYVQPGQPTAKAGGGIGSLIKRAQPGPANNEYESKWKYDPNIDPYDNYQYASENYFKVMGEEEKRLQDIAGLRTEDLNKRKSYLEADRANQQFHREQAAFTAMAKLGTDQDVTDAPGGGAGQLLTMLGKAGPEIGASETARRANIREQEEALLPLQIKYEEARASGNIALANSIMTQMKSISDAYATRRTAENTGAAHKLSSTLKPKDVQSLAASIVGDKMVADQSGVYHPEGKSTPEANDLARLFRTAERQMQSKDSATIKYKGKAYTFTTEDLGADVGTKFSDMINETGMEGLQETLMRYIGNVTGLGLSDQTMSYPIEEEISLIPNDILNIDVDGDFLKSKKKIRK